MYNEENYVKLLTLIKNEGYIPQFFSDHHEKDDKCIYLRHDIDYSVDWALRFATIDQANGIKATFTFQLRSVLYNLFSYDVIKQIQTISAMGHDIAVHFNIPSESLDDREYSELINSDFKSIKAVLPMVKPIISWHSPSARPELFPLFKRLEVCGFVNLFGKQFNGVVPYYSDSNMRYTYEELQQIIKKDEKKLQLLIHPFQWVANGKDMKEILLKTWSTVLYACETEFRTNTIYKNEFPHGIFSTITKEELNAILLSIAEK